LDDDETAGLFGPEPVYLVDQPLAAGELRKPYLIEHRLRILHHQRQRRRAVAFCLLFAFPEQDFLGW